MDFDDRMNRYFELAQIFATIAGGLFVAAAFFGTYAVSSLGNMLTLFSQQITLLISKDFPRLESVFNSTSTTMQKINDDFFRTKQYENYFFVAAFVFAFLAVVLGVYGFYVDRKQERTKSEKIQSFKNGKGLIMDKTNKQFFITLAFTLLTLGITTALFGLDKLGIVSVPIALIYTTVGLVISFVALFYLMKIIFF